MGETVIFFREDGWFYPVLMLADRPLAQQCSDHADINPGTVRIEDMQGNVLWPEGVMH